MYLLGPKGLQLRGGRSMKRALILLLLLGFTGCEVWHDTFSSREKQRCLYSAHWFHEAEEIKNAGTSSEFQKITSLLEMQEYTQLLIRDRCCRWKDTCVPWMP